MGQHVLFILRAATNSRFTTAMATSRRVGFRKHNNKSVTEVINQYAEQQLHENEEKKHKGKNATSQSIMHYY